MPLTRDAHTGRREVRRPASNDEGLLAVPASADKADKPFNESLATADEAATNAPHHNMTTASRTRPEFTTQIQY